MTNTIQVGILGLRRLGASFGLALARYNARKEARQQFSVTGYDTHQPYAQAAKTSGAVSAIAKLPEDAAAGKDIVILALPYSEVAGAYRVIGGAVRAGAVVLDAAPLKLPSMEWAKAHLSAQAHQIGITPILNPKYLFDGLEMPENASADLFDDGTMLILPSASSDRQAVELASDFSELLGAAPRFADPVEHDGWIASMEGLPALLGLGLFYMLKSSDGWDDVRRAGNPNFGRVTHHLFDTHPDDLRDLLLNNRLNTVHTLDRLIESLNALRETLAKNDRAALEELLINSAADYEKWLLRRKDGRWDERDRPAADRPDIMSGMLGGYLSKRIKRGKTDE